MPTVLRHAGFRVCILLPPREHGPPHVHVYRGGGVVTIALATTSRALGVLDVVGLRDPDVIAAVRLVQQHADFLLDQWQRYHG